LRRRSSRPVLFPPRTHWRTLKRRSPPRRKCCAGCNLTASCASDRTSRRSSLVRRSLKTTTEAKLMKVTKPLIITALVAGNLLVWNLALHAQNATNPPPPPPPAGGPPPGGSPGG